MDFIIIILVSTNWKGKSYNLILIIVSCLTKIVHYKSAKVMMDISGLAKMIIDMVVYYSQVPKSIISDQNKLFISKF